MFYDATPDSFGCPKNPNVPLISTQSKLSHSPLNVKSMERHSSPVDLQSLWQSKFYLLFNEIARNAITETMNKWMFSSSPICKWWAQWIHSRLWSTLRWMKREGAHDYQWHNASIHRPLFKCQSAANTTQTIFMQNHKCNSRKLFIMRSSYCLQTGLVLRNGIWFWFACGWTPTVVATNEVNNLAPSKTKEKHPEYACVISRPTTGLKIAIASSVDHAVHHLRYRWHETIAVNLVRWLVIILLLWLSIRFVSISSQIITH